MTTETILVPEIHRDHCKTSIEAALRPMEGVAASTVDVGGRTVTVSYDETAVGRDSLVAAIEDKGYVVPQGLTSGARESSAGPRKQYRNRRRGRCDPTPGG